MADPASLRDAMTATDQRRSEDVADGTIPVQAALGERRWQLTYAVTPP